VVVMLHKAKVDLVWFNAGGGHRAAAQALEQEIVAQGRPWQVSKLNLFEALDPGASFKRLTGLSPEDLYNKRLASGFTLGLAQELKLLQSLIRMGHQSLVRRLRQHWEVRRPDMVVSLIPNFNRCMHDALAQVRTGAPLVTVMTDMADFGPGFWIEPELQQHLICGTQHAAQQAIAAGVPASRVHRSSGMVLRPEFHLGARLDPGTRAVRQRALGLNPNSPVGLVLFGGTGSRVMKKIATGLPTTPLILMCGRNDDLARELLALPAQAPRVVVPYTPDVSRWMQLADFFIGKPGPGSISEAVQMGLPVIVSRNAWTLPQERWNTHWVQQHRLGVVVRSFSEVQPAVERVTSALPFYRSRVQAHQNQAVFEVPRILDRILTGRVQPSLADALMQAA